MNNKYSNLKIAWFPDKLGSLLKENITAPICVRIKPTNKCCHNCFFCVYNYDFSKMHEHVSRGDEIPVEKMMEILEDLKNIGTKAVTFSVRGDEQVLLSESGKIKVSEIKDLIRKKSFSLSEINGKIHQNRIIRVIRHSANNKLIKITTSGGYSISLTPNHSSMVYENRKMKVKKTSELKINDLFATPKIIKTPGIETEYSKDFFRLLGYFASEGSYGDCSLIFSLGNNKFEHLIIKDICSISKKFGCNYSMYKIKSKKNFNSIHIFSKELMLNFKKFILDKCRNKHIPNIVFNTTKTKKMEFLYGLYAGDGCVRFNEKRGKCVLSLKTSSKKLAEQTVLLLRTIGEFASIRHDFNKERFIGNRKLPITDYYTVELTGFRIIKIPFIKKLFKEKNIEVKFKKSKYSFIRNKSRIIDSYYKDLALLKITKIEEINNDPKETVYDLEIEHAHNFFCGNGLIETHNTGGGEPLVHKNAEAILQKTLDCKLDLSMLTNGQELEGKKSELMTRAKWIRISMDYWNNLMFSDTRKVTPKFFYKIVENIKNFAAINENCDLGVNYIITKKNYTTLIEAFDFITSLGVDNIRFSPLWVPDFYLYHQAIKQEVLNQLNQIYKKAPKEISVYDTYKITPEITTRTYKQCYFLQVVPVIGADCNIYNCHNKAYDSSGTIGSIENCKFSDVWFSEKTRNYFKNFRPDLLCNHQCANDQKNKYIQEILACSGDNYV